MKCIQKGYTLVVGLGISGRAIARHLSRLGVPFSVADTRSAPAGLDAFCSEYPDVEVHCGALTELDLDGVGEIVLSPGVDPRTPGLETVQALIVGEIELFVRALGQRPRPASLLAITGSNAKSTVTTLVGEMAQEAGIKVAVGGNLGTPALDLLTLHPDAECFVLELSSFQLETTRHLGADVACYLNLSEDHLDRHDGMAAYGAAKQRIFVGARSAVINGDDDRTSPVDTFAGTVTRFTLNAPSEGDWGMAMRDGELYLMRGDTPLMAMREVRLQGLHNIANVLAALAIGSCMHWSLEAMCHVLTRFAGLPHRAEFVAERDGVCWINDSKGTNVGATLAAIEGLGPTLAGKLILLAGGLGKGADFAPLAASLGRYARIAVLYGTDAGRIAQAIEHNVPVHRVDTLVQAMQYAHGVAHAGDCVLLSPACASLDQFSNYEARGEAFRAWVQACEDKA
ncbi:UDP-N-acetylmuramoyl-L-alanine--D-glutamate ligase [Phytohalomonas tamaricis]|uniref:UDP-N-acetylmuramoyl-L-alanine--D-glutamate ligase n=1 Tax=Phytohalomonas tamaricis TaxID=2081032 RepID=UPI000D0B0642|nr:UDP-N-acetylmuramoyl-L-alanine--D-glutamate ligase [Phytohalomonas tamaricis]